MEINIGDAVVVSILPCPLNQGCIAFNASDAVAELRQRQSEISQTAEKIEDCFIGLRIQPLHRLADHPAVDHRIDLGEIRRQKFKLQVLLRKVIAQCDSITTEWSDCLRTSLLDIAVPFLLTTVASQDFSIIIRER